MGGGRWPSHLSNPSRVALVASQAISDKMRAVSLKLLSPSSQGIFGEYFHGHGDTRGGKAVFLTNHTIARRLSVSVRTISV